MRQWLTIAALSVIHLTSCDDSDPLTNAADPFAADSRTAPADTRVPDTNNATRGGGDSQATKDTSDAFAANAGPSLRGLVGDPIVLDGSASTGAISYEWFFGTGVGKSDTSDSPIAETTYNTPGRYQAVLTIRNALGQKRTDSVVVSITHPKTHTPHHSSSVIALGDSPPTFAVISRDGDTLTRIAWENGALTDPLRVTTGDEPTSLSRNDDGLLAVVCRKDAVVQIWPELLTGAPTDIPLSPRGLPYGVIPAPSGWYITYEASGEVAHAVNGAIETVWPVIEDARHLAQLPDGRIAVSRFRSTGSEGTIAVLDPDSGQVSLVSLTYDPQIASDTEIGGIPNYLGPMLVSPTGLEAVLPSLQSNVGHGVWNNGIAFRPDTHVRAIASFLTLVPGVAERPAERKQFDSRGLTMAGTFSQFGDFIYLAMRGSRAIERYDVLTQNQAGVVLDVGYAPDGISLAGNILAVDTTLSRELVLFDVGNHEGDFIEVARAKTVDSEPLDPIILLGKQLFNDSFDDRLSLDGYMACAHCHLEGDTDNQVWDFTDRGEGLRNTISLIGRAGMGDGPLHWSANFDELQDFELDIRDFFGGDGLVPLGTPIVGDTPLDTDLAGISDALDALAVYMAGFATAPRSPYLSEDGSLTPEQAAGKALFESTATECMTCHTGERFTDSSWESPGVPLVHNVGTITAASGQRLGAALQGIDTPTLRGLWSSAPYLHDGSAQTLEDVLVTKNASNLHGKTSQLSPTELAQLIAYLLTL